MSNGAIAAACCCNVPCESDCCDWWACSPAGPINVTFSGSWVTNRSIVPGSQVFTVEEIYWTITATMTRTGSTCIATPPFTNLYRYVAATCNFSYQRIKRTYDVGNRFICNTRCVPPCCTCGDCYSTFFTPGSPLTGPGERDPFTPGAACGTGPACSSLTAFSNFDCNQVYTGGGPGSKPLTLNCFSWNCNPCTEPDCTGWGCPATPDDLIFRLVGEQEDTFVGVLTANTTNGCGSLDNFPFGPRHADLAGPGAVLTIVCSKLCNDCAKPLLIFNPECSGKTLTSTIDYSMDPCCPLPCEPFPPPCIVDASGGLPIKPFAVLGSGNCLNQSSFDAPTTSTADYPTPTGVWPSVIPGINFGGLEAEIPCTPLERTFNNKFCRYPEFENLYCAHNIEACYDAEGNQIPGTGVIDICYWPNWCEIDETVVSFNWGYV